MMRYNYTHSAYMLENESGTVEEMVENHDWARLMHWVDIFRYKCGVLEAAGLLDAGLDMQCMEAIERARYTQTYTRVVIANSRLDQRLETLPVYVAPVVPVAQSWTDRVRAFVGGAV